MKKPNPNDNPWRAAGMVSAIGADLIVCILLGYFGGSFVSDRFGLSPAWKAGGLIIGLFVGIVSVVFLIKRFLEDTNE
ncbi:Putative F0F1-ATPase subunit (ATPase_gene1) [Chlamydia abortus]|jgi:F0F1-type ATP synthase assembly protein I|uniref:AtpZ/AtpI family protein n=1 Tax=Paenibacillus residui TaxID=629724 RepID=A0ABW3DIA0_9BACL|nr:Putative F0F1-ATPase subunit (ATPase_gene1) [Chlamydia abortus]